MATAPMLTSLPRVDGQVGRVEWQSAAQLAPLSRLGSGVIDDVRRAIFVAWSRDALYVSWKIPALSEYVGGSAASSSHVDRLPPGEFVEFSFSPEPREPKLRHVFSIHASGDYAEGAGGDQIDPGWDCAWQRAVSISERGWEGEAIIPFDCLLQPPRPGALWRFDVFSGTSRTEQAASLGYRRVGADRAQSEPLLRFGDERDGAPAVRLARAGSATQGVAIVFDLVNTSYTDTSVRAHFTVRQRALNTPGQQSFFQHVFSGTDDAYLSGKSDFSKTTELAELLRDARAGYESVPGANVVDERTVPPGQRRTLGRIFNGGWSEYLLEYHLTTRTGTMLASGVLVSRVEAPLRVRVKSHVLSLKQIHADAEFEPGSLPERFQLDFELLGRAGTRVLRRTRYKVGSPARAKATLDVRGVPAGAYRLSTVVRDMDEAELIRQTQDFAIVEEPPWAHNQIGKHGVPKPWTPISADAAGHVKVWGRSYDLTAVFPKSVRVRGEHLLVRPTKLLLVSSGETLDWRVTRVELQSADASEALYKVELRAGTARLRGTIRAEFDGLIWYDLTLIPTAGELAIDRLELSIEMHERRGKLWSAQRYLDDPYLSDRKPRSGHEGVSGRLQSTSIPFSPSVWMGDESGGMTWIAEAPIDWQVQDADRVIQLEPRTQGGATSMRVRMVDHAVSLRRPMRLQFGLQATPIRPPAKPELTHIVQFGGAGADEPAYALIARNGGKVVVLHGGWKGDNDQEWSGWPGHPSSPERQKQLKESVRLAHKHGLKVIIYTGWGVDRRSEEWRLFRDEFARQPLENFGWGTYRQTTAPRGAYADYMAYTLAHLIREYGFDGVFWDSTANLDPSEEVELGAGWIDDQGRVRPGYPVLGTRELFRRIYALTHGELKQDGVVVNFGGSVWCVNAFSDIFHRGEGTPMHAKTLVDAWNPLEVFRADYAGRPFGLQFVALEKNFLALPMTANKYNAVALLHGTQSKYMGNPLEHPWLGQTYAERDVPMMRIWTARTWLPFDSRTVSHFYYEDAPRLIQTTPTKLLSSVFVSGDKRHALVVVSNLEGNAVQRAKIKIDVAGIGLSTERRTLRVADAVLGDVLQVRDAEVILDIASESYRLIKLWSE